MLGDITPVFKYTTPFPDHYYDDSFKLISQGSMNHIRYVFYWEAYEKNPSQFVKEIKSCKSSGQVGVESSL